MRIGALVVMLLIVTLIACRKENANQETIIERWRWNISTGGLSGNDTIGPSKSAVIVVHFKQDSAFTIEQNGQPISNGTFNVLYAGSKKLLNLKYTSTIEFIFQTSRKTLQQEGNELTLKDYNISEPYTHYFSRQY